MEAFPTPLEKIIIPEFFSPSSLARIEACPLSVFNGLSPDERLPPHPKSLLGNALHNAIHNASRRETTNPEALLRQWIGIEEERVIAILGSNHSLFPITNTVGREAYWQALSRLRRWIAKYPLPQEFQGFSKRKLPRSEETLSALEIRLQGRVDRLSWISATEVEIVDWKSGSSTDFAGNIKQEYRWQMYAYALLVESHAPGVAVQLALEGEKRSNIQWGDSERAEIEGLLQKLNISFPPHKVMQAESLSNPGQACRYCSIRHRCAAYIDRAPQWWRQPEGPGFGVPIDTWGEIIDLKGNGKQVTSIRLVEPSGRHSRITHPFDNIDGANIYVGQSLYCFGLLSSERYAGGRQPRNFHVDGSELGLGNAYQATFFVG
jgi:CRISPR/Cas system-associated exonuclease Cas4 (RecB family)